MRSSFPHSFRGCYILRYAVTRTGYKEAISV